MCAGRNRRAAADRDRSADSRMRADPHAAPDDRALPAWQGRPDTRLLRHRALSPDAAAADLDPADVADEEAGADVGRQVQMNAVGTAHDPLQRYVNQPQDGTPPERREARAGSAGPATEPVHDNHLKGDA